MTFNTDTANTDAADIQSTQTYFARHVEQLDQFSYQQGALTVEQVSLADVAKEYGSPCYVYSKAAILARYTEFSQHFAGIDNHICYAVKANANLAILQLLAQVGAGFDIVSRGELERVLAAGGKASKVVFSGLSKSEDDIQRALEVGIACFNVESEVELTRINAVAKRLQVKAPISLRVNPNVDAKTHPYISTGLKENKFGIAHDAVVDTYQKAAQFSHLDVIGIDCHIGSQLTELAPFSDALDRLIDMINELKQLGINLKHIDLGGGLGVRYDQEEPPSIADYAHILLPKLQQLGLTLYLEPGRAIVANAGVLLTQVETLKPTPHKNFAVVDAAMNDLIRPALYAAHMVVTPVQLTQTHHVKMWDIVGGICETGDFLAKNRTLALQQGDLLAVTGAGAYGFVMASNYNTRPRAAEVLVDGSNSYLIREREALSDLWKAEKLLSSYKIE